MKTTLLSMLAVLTLSVAAATEAPQQKVPPISAIAVSECGKAVVIFVTLDAAHMLRLDARGATLFTVNPDGTVQEAHAQPMEISAAVAIATSARIQSHVTLPCRENVI